MCSDVTLEILEVITEHERDPNPFMIKNRDARSPYPVPKNNGVYLILGSSVPDLGVEEVKLKVTADGGSSQEFSLQVTFTIDCREKFVDPAVIIVEQRKKKMTFSLDELKLALDLENCPVEGMSLVEE
jgi:hypothetical protein